MAEPVDPSAALRRMSEENLKRLARVRAETDLSQKARGLEEGLRRLTMELEVVSRNQMGQLHARLDEVRERLEEIPREAARVRDSLVREEHRRWEGFRALLEGDELQARLQAVQGRLAEVERETEATAALRRSLEEGVSEWRATDRKRLEFEGALEGLRRRLSDLEGALAPVRESVGALAARVEEASSGAELRLRDLRAHLDDLEARLGSAREVVSRLAELKRWHEETGAALPAQLEHLNSRVRAVEQQVTGLEAEVQRRGAELTQQFGKWTAEVRSRSEEAGRRLQEFKDLAAAGEAKVMEVSARAQEVQREVSRAFEQVPLELEALKESVASALAGAQERLRRLEEVASAAPQTLQRSEEAARRIQEFLERTRGLAEEGPAAEGRLAKLEGELARLEGRTADRGEVQAVLQKLEALASEVQSRIEGRLAEVEKRAVGREEFEALTREIKEFFDALIREREKALQGMGRAAAEE